MVGIEYFLRDTFQHYIFTLRCNINIAWFSGGVTSAVACYYALKNLNDVVIIYIETGSHHPDHSRFILDCENWYDRKIIILQSSKFKNVFDVINRVRFINGPFGAACTRLLKKDVRKEFEKSHNIESQVWGFEFSPTEINRSNRHKNNNPEMKCYFPLIDNKITKQDAINTLIQKNIQIPTMYQLGYHNSNCIGCVKGGAAYWNKIRIDFPDIFNEMAKTERAIGRSCLKKYFLDELPLNAGRGKPLLVFECGSVGEGCETALAKGFLHFQNME